LKGEEIPIGARIVAAVDCLDALASDRQYRRALPLDDAMAWVVEESGKSFDPKVVDLLQRRYREFEQLARKEGQGALRISTGIKTGNDCGPAKP
jgi:HD-GYP domain-containing protein (c-di-GMP phosphodiesterase class II)